MVSYLLRYLRVIFQSCFRSQMGPLDTSVMNFIAWPFDCELRALNGARAMAIMDNARMDFVARSGMLRAMLKNGWLISIGAQRITYFRRVPLFSRFKVEARIVSWHGRWCICECKILLRGKLAAIGHQRCLLGGKKAVTAQMVIDAMGSAISPPPLPTELEEWVKMEDIFFAQGKI